MDNQRDTAKTPPPQRLPQHGPPPFILTPRQPVSTPQQPQHTAPGPQQDAHTEIRSCVQKLLTKKEHRRKKANAPVEAVPTIKPVPPTPEPKKGEKLSEITSSAKKKLLIDDDKEESDKDTAVTANLDWPTKSNCRFELPSVTGHF